MLVIGLTGGIGSGKTTVANMFAKYHVPIIDADHIARELTSTDKNIIDAIVKHFPNTNLIHENKLDRATLRTIIFNKPEEKQWLENLLHPRIKNEIEQRIAFHTEDPYLIVVIPLLFEVAPYSYIDRILVIDTPEHLQIERVMERDASEVDLIKKIIDSQIPRNERLRKAKDLIVNDHDLHHLKNQVDKFHQFYLRLGNSK